MKQAIQPNDDARELTLEEKVELELARRGVSSARPMRIKNQQTTNLDRGGSRGLQRQGLAR